MKTITTTLAILFISAIILIGAEVNYQSANIAAKNSEGTDLAIEQALSLYGFNLSWYEEPTMIQKIVAVFTPISHVQYIVMNPPFNADEKHILHAYNIAPAGCDIIVLCNLSTVKNTYTKQREELRSIVDMYGSFEELGKCFAESERHTFVYLYQITIKK